MSTPGEVLARSTTLPGWLAKLASISGFCAKIAPGLNRPFSHAKLILPGEPQGDQEGVPGIFKDIIEVLI